MGRVRYAKSVRDLDTRRGRADNSVDTSAENGEARSEGPVLSSTVRSIRCRYETDAEVAQAVVPKPLEASVHPEVHLCFASVAMHIAPEVTLEIRSASFGVRVEYDDRPGNYLLTMPMSSEAAVVGGRERFGEPKKLAQIEFYSAGEKERGTVAEHAVSARVERMGVTYLSAVGKRVEALGAREETELAYCFKAFPSVVAGKGFDHDPQLVRLEWRHRYDQVWRLEGGIELWDSPFDPVADLPVRRLIVFEYAEGRTESLGRVLRPVPGEWLLPFMHQRYDEPEVEGVEV